jgi:hypothetical protein
VEGAGLKPASFFDKLMLEITGDNLLLLNFLGSPQFHPNPILSATGKNLCLFAICFDYVNLGDLFVVICLP